MTRRLLVTIVALVSALSLSASVALAAAPTRRTGHMTPMSTAAAHRCGQAQTEGGIAAHPQTTADRPQAKPTADDGTSDTDTDSGSGSTGTDNQRPHNHGWFVSQVAKNHTVTGKAHGQAVSAEAQSNDGKPDQSAR